MKEWKTINWSDECPLCGCSTVEVFTDCSTENHAYDGDTARCTECKAEGWVTVWDEDNASIRWIDEDGE